MDTSTSSAATLLPTIKPPTMGRRALQSRRHSVLEKSYENHQVDISSSTIGSSVRSHQTTDDSGSAGVLSDIDVSSSFSRGDAGNDNDIGSDGSSDGGCGVKQGGNGNCVRKNDIGGVDKVENKKPGTVVYFDRSKLGDSNQKIKLLLNLIKQVRVRVDPCRLFTRCIDPVE